VSLKDVHSQQRVINALERAFCAGKMPHAYIFAGPDGVGKRTLAHQWAKMLLCQDRIKKKNKHGISYDSCGKCRSCTVFEGGGHPDFNFIYKELAKFTKDGKNRTTPIDMPIDVIRDFLIDRVANRPQMSEYVVHVMDEAEKLNRYSQNALLKLLEEPAQFCVIILLCSRLDKMLPTTLSRCQVLRFAPVEERYIVVKLKDIGVSKEQATYWARFSQGSIGTAMAWAGLDVGQDKGCYEVKRELVGRLAEYELSDALDFAEWLCAEGKRLTTAWSKQEPNLSTKDVKRRVQKGLLQMIIAVYNDAMHLKTGSERVLVNNDQLGPVKSISGRFEAQTLAERVDKAYESCRWVDASVNEKLIFEELLLNYGSCGIMV
jgi:DNA polymerase-3 subunit delta'